jgi:hypothetical protein
MGGERSAFSIERYYPDHAEEWDAFVSESKNATFLFMRTFMDHHRDRFQDHSLIIRKDDKIFALMPANRVGDELHSHQGLSYGGLITSQTMTTPRMLQIFKQLLEHLRSAGLRRLYYKTIPAIYHLIPAEEDLYALFLADATLRRRDTLSVIPLQRRGPVQMRRRRGSAKAKRQGIVVSEGFGWRRFWTLLSDVLWRRYGVDPVHSVDQIEYLSSQFPDNIRLFEARHANELLAGVVIFESAMVAHVQYIAASEVGRKAGGLDLLFEYLVEQVFHEKPYFDFGISNENQGRYLNIGLIEQKEGFGARTLVHDFYEVDLDRKC